MDDQRLYDWYDIFFKIVTRLILILMIVIFVISAIKCSEIKKYDDKYCKVKVEPIDII